MSVHSSRKLFDLATKTSQKLEFEKFLASASISLRTRLGSATTIYHPRTPQALISAVQTAIQAHDHAATGTTHAGTTRNPREANSWVKAAVLRMPSEVPLLMHFGGSTTIMFNGDAVWVPKYPVVQLPKKDALACLDEALEASHDSFCIVSASMFAVLDSYLDSTTCGPTYEFTESWGDA